MRVKSISAAGVVLCSALSVAAQSASPLRLLKKYEMPVTVKGRFDHLGVDLKGNRLFLAAEGQHSVLVFNLRGGDYIREIPDIQIPHAIFVREDLDRIYITDGGPGALKIYDGKTYNLLKTIPLKQDADSIGYDPQTKYLYIVNGGGDAHETSSTYSVVDTTKDEKLADIKIVGDTLEASALEQSGPRIFVENPSRSQVEVIDRTKRTVEASWPIQMAKGNVAIALDESGHRLFVACRSGKIVVLDSMTGKELQTLDIGKGVDDLIFDPSSKRIYASCGGGTGFTYVYQEQDPDHYKLLDAVATAPGGKNEILVSQLGMYFIIVPPTASARGSVYAYKVQ